MGDPRDAPTPKQSGTYAVMSGICLDTIRELHEWFLVAPESVDMKILTLESRFKKCANLITDWTPETSREDRQNTVNTVLSLREEAQDLALSYGHTLGRGATPPPKK